MSPEGFASALRSFTRRRVFHPFLIEFLSGERLLVTHREAVAGIAQPLYVYVSPNMKYRLFEAASVCPLLDVPT